MTAAKVTALIRKTVPALVATRMAPPIAGPTGAGEVLVDRAERDRLRTLGRGDELRLQGLPGRRRQGLTGPDREQQRQQRPRRDQSRDGQCAQRGRRGQHQGLGDQQEPASVDQVTDRARQHREQQHRQAGRGLDQRDVGRRGGQAQHQPLRGDGLHPTAGIADELRPPHGREQPVAERRPRRHGPGRMGI